MAKILSDLRILKSILITTILLGCAIPAAAQAEWRTDLELRVGYGKACGFCSKGAGQYAEYPSVQIWADRLRQFDQGEWRWLAGPYVKGTHFDNALLGEGGVDLGGGRGPFELHIHAGASYATENIGSNPAIPHQGMERLTAGLGVRGIVLLSDTIYFSLNWDHNTGGPGLEQFLVGLGYRW
jgi:hypothetical protein